MYKISVVIPVFNVEDYLEKCILKLMSQTLTEIQMIFINDGSTDKSLEILKKYEKKDSRIKVINKKNEGVSIARNLGIDCCSAEYIAFMDPDDYIEENAYEVMYNRITADDSDLVACNVIAEKKCKSSILFNFNPSNLLDLRQCNNILRKQLICERKNGYCWNKIYKKEMISKNNIKFDENITMYEDFLFNLNYMKYVNKVSLISEYLYHYNLRDDSATKIIHYNQFEVIRKVYKTIRECMIEWNIEDKESIKAVDQMYLKFPYKNSKEQLTNKEILKDSRVRNIEGILKDPLTKYMKEQVNNKLVSCRKREKLFYSICNYKMITLIYLEILNFVTFIKKIIR